MTVPIQQAQSNLLELIRKLSPGETLTLTDGEVPVATVAPIPPARKDRTLGTLKGTVLYMAPDFRATPEGFEEYTS